MLGNLYRAFYGVVSRVKSYSTILGVNGGSVLWNRILVAPSRPMVAAAELAFNLALPTESIGNRKLSLPDRNVRGIRMLFETWVSGFYLAVLSVQRWRVDSGNSIG